MSGRRRFGPDPRRKVRFWLIDRKLPVRDGYFRDGRFETRIGIATTLSVCPTAVSRWEYVHKKETT